jgi:hypothetical protein
MTPDTLWRLGAGAAILGGALRIAAAFIPYTPLSWPLEALYAVIDVSLLLGLTTIYLREADALGSAGLAGFATAFAGLASIVGPDAQTFGLDWYQAGAALSAMGTVGLGVTMLLARRMTAVAVCWIAVPIVALAGPTDLAFQAAGALFGMGFVLAGLHFRK